MFADRIKELRVNNQLSQRAFAESLGISQTTLVSYEKGGKTPSYDILVRIARKFNISLDWLCEIEKPKENEYPKTLADILRVFANLARLWDWGKAITVSKISKAHDTSCCFTDICLYGCGAGKDIFGCGNQVCNCHYTYTFLHAFDELSKMVKLVREGTIQENLFNLWLDDQCKKVEEYDVYGNEIKATAEEAVTGDWLNGDD